MHLVLLKRHVVCVSWKSTFATLPVSLSVSHALCGRCVCQCVCMCACVCVVGGRGGCGCVWGRGEGVGCECAVDSVCVCVCGCVCAYVRAYARARVPVCMYFSVCVLVFYSLIKIRQLFNVTISTSPNWLNLFSGVWPSAKPTNSTERQMVHGRGGGGGGGGGMVIMSRGLWS